MTTLLWLGAIASAVLAILVVARTERALRRDPGELDPRDARFGRPLIAREQGVRFARAFRWWSWAGALLVLGGGIALAASGGSLAGVDIGATLLGSGGLAWVLGGIIGVTRAHDRRDDDDLDDEPRRAARRAEERDRARGWDREGVPEGRPEPGAAAAEGAAQDPADRGGLVDPDTPDGPAGPGAPDSGPPSPRP